MATLTRPEGRVQRVTFPLNRHTKIVSILTRPEGRVQPGWLRIIGISVNWFQSSPAPKDGCNIRSPPNSAPSWLFQSSPAPKDGCNRGGSVSTRVTKPVSILTRPEGRVQRGSGATLPLTGSRFNPHPPRRTGATVLPMMPSRTPARFQSSPAPKDGCNCRGVFRHAPARQCFNPHPPRRTGATPSACCAAPHTAQFQSSPAPKDGCNGEAVATTSGPMVVSILTRPEGRGATPSACCAAHTAQFHLTRPEGRVQR